ncbi:hypothetical protein B9Z65_3963 [Elsinoe australis]|uniref:Uncharacterized protein n=1 Tax=Elsinoe australis TaxID=40998 RepID=A0A2P7Z1G2_9PEZI|nr:hypothetical protein B9Z65_3963 [Elsinoe australis]
MSDLCYNCGSCHLPLPCNKPLVLCNLCHQLGHTNNFCHKGYQTVDSSYHFYALCHSCTLYHLPKPCQKSHPARCTTCYQTGHLPFYCPVAPAPRNTMIPMGHLLVTTAQLQDLQVGIADFVLEKMERGWGEEEVRRHVRELPADLERRGAMVGTGPKGMGTGMERTDSAVGLGGRARAGSVISIRSDDGEDSSRTVTPFELGDVGDVGSSVRGSGHPAMVARTEDGKDRELGDVIDVELERATRWKGRRGGKVVASVEQPQITVAQALERLGWTQAKDGAP